MLLVCIYIECVLRMKPVGANYQVTDWSMGPRTSAIPRDIFDTIFMTSFSDTNQRKIVVSFSENFGEI